MNAPDHAEALLNALRALGGRATLGDLVAKTTLATAQVEQSILPTLSLVGGHVAVDDHGTLLYTIDKTTPLPELRSRWSRLGKGLWLAFQSLFFAVLSLMLVAYGVFYIALLLVLAVAAVAAATRGSDCDCDCDCGDCGKCGGGCNCNGCGDVCYGCSTRKRPDKLAERQALRDSQMLARIARTVTRKARAAVRIERWRAALGDIRRSSRALGFDLEPEELAAKPPFLRAVRDFVFGPLRPPEDPSARERNLLGFVRDHDGRMTATDAAMVTGLPLDQADRVLLALAVKVDGDVAATEDGAVVYAFDRFMVSVGSDLPSLEWILAGGGTTTVGEFARREETDADDALERLQALVKLAGGEVRHGETTRFWFPPEAAQRLDVAASEYAALRDFTYCWERLEKAPAVIGVPVGERGWIWGFNTLNIAVSLGLCIYYGTGERLLDSAWEVPLLGIFPLVMSLSVFAIVLLRAIVIGIGNSGRRRRNAHRRALLALVHRAEHAPSVRSIDLRTDLGLDARHAAAMDEHLALMLRELDGDFDVRRTDTYRFERVHRELRAVQRARDELDPRAFVLETIVYDTSEPM